MLDALLGTNGSGLLGGLLGGAGGGLLGGLLGTTTSTGSTPDPVGNLFTTLTDVSATDTGSATTSGGSADLLSVVTRLLPTVARRTDSPAPVALKPLATACTRQLSGTLPLLTGLR